MITSGTEANISRSNSIQITNELTSGVNAIFGSNVCIATILANNNLRFFCWLGFSYYTVADLRGRQGHAPPYRSKFFNFYAVFGNNFAIGKIPKILDPPEIVNIPSLQRFTTCLQQKEQWKFYLLKQIFNCS